MLPEAIYSWLDADVSFTWPMAYGNIPQNQTSFPFIIICPVHRYDHGITAKVTVAQKIVHFDVIIQGTNLSSLTPVVTALLDKFSAISAKSEQEIIGAYRCQCIQVLDTNYSDGIYSASPNDRRVPGAPEKDYTWAVLSLRASYHKIP